MVGWQLLEGWPCHIWPICRMKFASLEANLGGAAAFLSSSLWEESRHDSNIVDWGLIPQSFSINHTELHLVIPYQFLPCFLRYSLSLLFACFGDTSSAGLYMTKLSYLTAWPETHCLFDITNSAYNVLWRSLRINIESIFKLMIVLMKNAQL